MIIVSGRPHLGGGYSGPEPSIDGFPGDDDSLTVNDDICFTGGSIFYEGPGGLDILILLDEGEFATETNEDVGDLNTWLNDCTYHVGMLDEGGHTIELRVRRNGETEWADTASFLLTIQPAE